MRVDTLTSIKVFRQVVESVPDVLLSEPTFKGALTPTLTDYPLQEPRLY